MENESLKEPVMGPKKKKNPSYAFGDLPFCFYENSFWLQFKYY